MNRATRDKLAGRTDQQRLTQGTACWETAPAVWLKIIKDFGPFDIDLTADAKRALLPKWFGPDSPYGRFDALSADWRAYGRTGYSNPPYGAFVADMLAQAKRQSAKGFKSTLLLPMRVTKAFLRDVLDGASELHFSDRRLIFWENGAPRLNPKSRKPDAAMFDSIIVRYLKDASSRPSVHIWHAPSAAEMAMTFEQLAARNAVTPQTIVPDDEIPF